MKAAVLIQQWYRRYMARLEMRRRYTWNIFQSIEYAGEQDQLQLSSFFSFMLDNFTQLNENGPDLISQLLDPVVDPWLGRETGYNLIPVPESYSGPRLSFPLSVSDTNSLLGAFKEQQETYTAGLMTYSSYFTRMAFPLRRRHMCSMGTLWTVGKSQSKW